MVVIIRKSHNSLAPGFPFGRFVIRKHLYLSLPLRYVARLKYPRSKTNDFFWYKKICTKSIHLPFSSLLFPSLG